MEGKKEEEKWRELNPGPPKLRIAAATLPTILKRPGENTAINIIGSTVVRFHIFSIIILIFYLTNFNFHYISLHLSILSIFSFFLCHYTLLIGSGGMNIKVGKGEKS